MYVLELPLKLNINQTANLPILSIFQVHRLYQVWWLLFQSIYLLRGRQTHK